jgi:hypothetical protein
LIRSDRHPLIESRPPIFGPAKSKADSLCRSSAGQLRLPGPPRHPPVDPL